MKISQILAISLSVVSGSAMAFQAKDKDPAEFSRQQIRGAEFAIYDQAISTQGVSGFSQPGSCAATPVSGCNCPFCTMLRSQRV
ncbi:hypothetical protein PUATCC27989T_02500 [Phytobacter ursingii]|jgi:hypothetical protein|uniref:Uncharacterized protein n=2 Tax=Enterobacteriaceae TaxID=543 RepID=A0AB35RSI7_9ENTR|nr:MULTISPECIES: hypothetical protein [Enterobacteriaceae]MDU6684730.1 hypothetical protein [Enterobacteriaceae bacterium]MCL9671703.1 hypothetical protein [Citrobacter sp. MNAZ 1397]MDV2864943.1 hypothetical protein [Phytobacter ursingii]ORJ50593.1 hypothetical protein B2M27_09985 [Kluyvera intermedia]VTP14635.1 hypothetical protein PUATCC27989T_02500 [Phytobacter ursingii]